MVDSRAAQLRELALAAGVEPLVYAAAKYLWGNDFPADNPRYFDFLTTATREDYFARARVKIDVLRPLLEG